MQVDEVKVNGLLAERDQARRGRDFDTADRIRELLRGMGVVVDDKKGTWRAGTHIGGGVDSDGGGRSGWGGGQVGHQGCASCGGTGIPGCPHQSTCDEVRRCIMAGAAAICYVCGGDGHEMAHCPLSSRS